MEHASCQTWIRSGSSYLLGSSATSNDLSFAAVYDEVMFASGILFSFRVVEEECTYFMQDVSGYYSLPPKRNCRESVVSATARIFGD